MGARAEELEPEQPMPLPPLSIVILTCDSAATIGTCLESLVAQDHADFEVVIVDDRSTDGTLDRVEAYRDRLDLRVVHNGARNIPRGRNLGLAASRNRYVAFLDSDDWATPNWSRAIAAAFREMPDVALIAGAFVPDSRTQSAEAIGLCDATVHDLAGNGMLEFSAGRMAIDTELLSGDLFDEQFVAAEDLDLAARILPYHRCEFVPDIVIHRSSRDTFGAYASQMYRYGAMKVQLGYAERSHRWLDFVPLGVLGVSAAAAVALRRPWLALAIVPFSVAESAFVIAVKRPRPVIAALTVPSWLTKNVAWSAGVVAGFARLAAQPKVRRRLRATRLPA
jgi:cellulose synthase/poly-beta-1,6-N-acetylglucosamine synthase-like glycosyltransferase